MGDYFTNDHVMNLAMPGSLGPSVSLDDITRQVFQQQFHVGSARALDQELANRWGESLQALANAGHHFNAPVNLLMMRGYAEYVRHGTPVTDPTIEGVDPNAGPYARYGARINEDVRQPDPEFEEMRRANDTIRQLNDPRIKSFEQILDEVSQMQRDTEERTASMIERGPTGSILGEILGGAAGSFTTRDPLNLATMPLGFGRTIAMRIASDMGIAALTTAATEFGDVQPNRALAELPERNPWFDIASSAIGAGLFRAGLLEPLHGLASLEGVGRDIEGIDFDLRDHQLQQMFHAMDDSPTARAASSILEDTTFYEHVNPYGEGQVAGYRWQAELEATARALNGEEAPQVDMPPIPHEYIDQALNFQSVKETAPELWNKLEAVRTRVTELDQNINEVISKQLTIPDAVRLVDQEAAAKLDRLSEVVNDMTQPEPVRAAADMEARGIVLRVGQDKIMKAVQIADTAVKHEVRNLRASRKAANKQYMAAYRAVEQEAMRLEQAEAAKRSIAQTQSIDVLGPHITSEPMTGPLTRHDFVESHVTRVEEADKNIEKQTEAVNELQIDPETNMVNLGGEPIAADFKVPFEDGEMTVKEVLDDLAEDKRLEEAMKGCTL